MTTKWPRRSTTFMQSLRMGISLLLGLSCRSYNPREVLCNGFTQYSACVHYAMCRVHGDLLIRKIFTFYACKGTVILLEGSCYGCSWRISFTFRWPIPFVTNGTLNRFFRRPSTKSRLYVTYGFRKYFDFLHMLSSRHSRNPTMVVHGCLSWQVVSGGWLKVF